MKKWLVGCGVVVLLGVGLIPVLISRPDWVFRLATAIECRLQFRRHYQEAHNGGDHQQWLLGQHYEYGNGTSPDMAEAVRWYRYSAERGIRDGQLEYVRCLLNGKGVPRDEVEALMWLNLVASDSSPSYVGKSGAEYRDSVAARLTPEQIERAAAMTRSWRPKSWEELKRAP
jgi:hypothetical protein